MPYNILNEINRDLPPELRERHGDSALFTAFGCVMLEQEAGTRFAYRAVNLTTGRSAVVWRKNRPVTANEIQPLTQRLRQSPVAGPGRFETDMPPGEKLDRGKLAEILAYVFDEALPEHGFARREPQIRLAEQILQSLCRRDISLSEAEVGTGKTHAYLIAAALVKRGRVNDFWLRMSWPGQGYAESAYMPVVVSTSSIALQKAIIRDYIPEISRILQDHGVIREPLTCAMRKGKGHFVCERKLRAYYEDADEAARRQLLPLLEQDAADLGDLDSLTPYVKRRVGVSGRCERDCPHRGACRYRRQLNGAQSSRLDFQVCNHNYLLADMARRANGQPPLIPHYQAVIIDEGHKLLDAARQMYGTEFHSDVLPKLAADLEGFTYRKGGGEIPAQAKRLAEQSDNLFRRLVQNIPKSESDEETERYATVIDAEAARSLSNIHRMAGQLSHSLSDKQALTKYEGRRAQMLWELKDAKEQAARFQSGGDMIYWLELPEGRALGDNPSIRLCGIPRNLDALLHRDLWAKGLPVVLTSGTLSASRQSLSGGDFTHIKRSLGIDRLSPTRIRETSQPSPFDYRKNALLYISESAPFPGGLDRAYLTAVADEVERLIRAAHGHTAVLFTSYNAMGIVYQDISRRGLPFPLFRLDRGNASEIARFRDSGNGVLFASGALWEGIDLPGDILSMLIIVKLPFAVPDPISEYERTLYPGMAQYKDAVVVPEMIVKLKQGFGRLIRTDTDTGVVALLDCRVREGGPYRERVLAALPPCPVTSYLRTVEAFLKSRKEPGYWK